MKYSLIACVVTSSLLAGTSLLGADAEVSTPACGVAGAATCTIQAATNAPIAAAKAQTTCPVMKGNPINPKLFVEQDGKRIYVCCAGCIASVKKNFAKYAKQIEADGVVLETVKPVK